MYSVQKQLCERTEQGVALHQVIGLNEWNANMETKKQFPELPIFLQNIARNYAYVLKDKFTQKGKFRHYLLDPMWTQNQVKFCSRRTFVELHSKRHCCILLND